MENNDSPYVYEKPLRARRVKGSKRLPAIAALGLVGLGGIFGGGAFANGLVDSTKSVNASGENTTPDVVVDASNPSVAISADSAAQIVSLPLQEAKPKPNSAAVSLPKSVGQTFGNTSSATPSAGSGSASYGTNAEDGYEQHGSSQSREYEDD